MTKKTTDEEEHARYIKVNPRQAIWEYLVRTGPIEDPTGKLPTKLARLMGWSDDTAGRSRISTALQQLEEEGCAVRDHGPSGHKKRLYGVMADPSQPPVSGRRTKIPLAPRVEAEYRPKVNTPEPVKDIPEHVDYDQLAMSLLKKVVATFSESSGEADELRRQVMALESARRSLQNRLDTINIQLRDTRNELEAARDEAQHLRREAAARQRRSETIHDQLDDSTKRKIDRLMKELPNGH